MNINGLGNTPSISSNRLKAEVAPTTTPAAGTGLTGLNNLAPTPRASSILGNSQGMLFGENHANVDSKAALAGMMGDLSQEGVSTLFLEQFEATDQPVLDAYMQNPTAENRAAVQKSLEKYTTYTDKETGERVDGYPTETYMQLIDRAIENNMKVVGINDMNAPDRSAFMAEQIKQKSGNDKYVALVGSFHTDSSASADEVKQRQGSEFQRGIDSFIDVKTHDFQTTTETPEQKEKALAQLNSNTTPSTTPPPALKGDAEATQVAPKIPQAGSAGTGASGTLRQIMTQLLEVVSAFLSSNRA